MRIILTASAFFFITFFGIGQSNKLDIQVEGGPSLITVYGGPLNDIKPLLNGFTGGVYLNYNINKHQSIKSGIGYERKGFKQLFNINTLKGYQVSEYDINLDYLVVPLLIHANFGSKLRFFVNGGPYLGYLVNQHLTYRDYPQLNGTNFTDKKIELGISTGIGCSFPMNKLLSFKVEVRNNFTLNAITDYDNLSSNSTNFILGVIYHRKD